jgi:glucokinase
MGCACGLTLPQMFRKKTEQGIKTTLPLPDDFDFSKVDGKMIKQGLDINDPLSKSIVNDCADYIGIGIYNIFQVFNPPVIILGGGLMNLGEFYFNRIKSKFYELARDMIYDPVEIVKSEAEADAGDWSNCPAPLVSSRARPLIPHPEIPGFYCFENVLGCDVL